MIFAIVLSLGLFLLVSSISYGVSKNNTCKQTEELFSSAGYQVGYANNEVKSTATISIESIRKENKLEVLEVSDVEYVTTNAYDENGNLKDNSVKTNNVVKIWAEIPGNGVFSVNLEQAEILVDNERKIVSIRLPDPELTECAINESEIKLLNSSTGIIFNGSSKDGFEVGREVIIEGQKLIRNTLRTNVHYYDSAKNAAKRIVESLVRSVNKDIPELQVYVEFYD